MPFEKFDKMAQTAKLLRELAATPTPDIPESREFDAWLLVVADDLDYMANKFTSTALKNKALH